MDKLLNIDELAAILNIKKSHIYALIHRREIPHIKIGGRVLFDLQQIKKFVADRTINPI